MRAAIIIPYRGTLSDKSRLRKDLKNSAVELLLHQMTQNVINETLKLNNEFTIYLLTKKKQIDFSGKFEVLEDEGEELNESISLAIKKIQEENVVIVMADLPLIESESIADIIKTYQKKKSVVLAPTEDKGTSIICFDKAIQLPKVFGKNSSLRFKEWFEKNSTPIVIMEYIEAYRDIDTFKDLIELKENNFLPEWINRILKVCVKNE